MKNLLYIFLCFLSTALFAHNGVEHANNALKEWHFEGNIPPLKASLMLFKDKTVCLEDAGNRVSQYPLSALKLEDQLWVIQKYQHIERLNASPLASSKWGFKELIKYNFWLLVWFSSLMWVYLFIRSRKHFFNLKYTYTTVLIGITVLFLSFMPRPILGTDPNFIDSAFVPFKPKVKTRWDNQYFYVEGLGLPSHPMMIGITAWQQQVPITQCYTGTNAWSIPLNPVVAATPVPTATNFFKGAVAIAANGIPIFNALNNRGEDSYLIGELDKYGGHCGRADDYHYHVAPLSLDSISSDILPIAFALDGFAVYAAKEPDGTAMKTLDANHGHYLNGVYHYHGTKDYPYVVGNMVGVVTKDATDQIIPQAQTKAIRPAGTPLSGAVITNHQSTGTNAYSLTYSLNNQSYTINYSWTSTGSFNFKWASPSGVTDSTYKGTVCTLPTPTNEINQDNSYLKIYPNPALSGFSLEWSSPLNVNDIQNISIINVKGQTVYQVKGYKNYIEIPHFTEGVYFVKVQFSQSQIVKKLVVKR